MKKQTLMIFVTAAALTGLVGCDTGTVDESTPVTLVGEPAVELSEAGGSAAGLESDEQTSTEAVATEESAPRVADSGSVPSPEPGDEEPSPLDEGSEDTGDAPIEVDEPMEEVEYVAPVNLCEADVDQDTLQAYPEPALYKWVLAQVQGCFYGLGGSKGHQKIQDDVFHGCVGDAMTEDLGLTNSCSTCFADIGLCSKVFCTKSCGNIQVSEHMNLQGCLDCQKENYCAHSFDTCVGSPMLQNLVLPQN